MGRYTVFGVAENCFTQTRITLANGVEVLPLDEPLAFRGEAEWVLEIAAGVGANVSTDFATSVRGTVADSQHGVFSAVQRR